MSKANQNFDLLKKKTPYSVTRLGALYRDFSESRELNPEGYEANLISWTNILKVILEQDAIDGKLSVPHKKPELAGALILPTIGKPLSMDLIIRELVASKTLIPVSMFLKFDSRIDNYIHPRGFPYIYPSHWIGKVSEIGNGLISLVFGSSERYIHYNHLCDFSKQFMTVINKQVSVGLYTSKVFDQKLILSIIHEEVAKNFTLLDLQILLKHLSRDVNECSTKQVNDSIIVKFDEKDVTDEDVGIGHLRWNIHQVLDRMVSAELKMEDISSKINKYPSEKIKKDETVKTTVKHLLVQRRMHAKVYEQCGDTLTSLNGIIHKIDDATTNISVVNALKQSSKSLRLLNAQVELEELDDIYLDVQEGMEETDRVTEALVVDKQDVDVDVEEEYNRLLKEHEEEETESGDLLKKLQGLSVEPGQKEQREPQSQPQRQSQPQPELIQN